MANQSLTATPVDPFKIKLDWNLIACTPNPCDNPDGYEIEKQVWNGQWALIKTMPGDKTTFTDTVGIQPLKTYKYRVRSLKGADESPYSNVAAVTTPPYTDSPPTCP